jgi:hypothetical protein
MGMERRAEFSPLQTFEKSKTVGQRASIRTFSLKSLKVGAASDADCTPCSPESIRVAGLTHVKVLHHFRRDTIIVTNERFWFLFFHERF